MSCKQMEWVEQRFPLLVFAWELTWPCMVIAEVIRMKLCWIKVDYEI